MKNEIEFKFGNYAIIEQKRHGVPNEMFVHKVVGQLRSNTWVDVPVSVPATETLHGEMEDICLCICCGIDETEVRRYRVKDMRRHSSVSLVADEKRGSTITQQAVNELIQSLESAGELSIKETKVMALAKAYQQLAAENVGLKEACGGNGSYRNCPACTFSEYIEAPETPATDRIVAGIKASTIPEGFKLVPEQMYLSDEDIQAICMQCGNGDKKGYGDYEDGILWVGELSNDGEMKYGLNIANANYPEEGSITVFEFDEPLREGADK